MGVSVVVAVKVGVGGSVWLGVAETEGEGVQAGRGTWWHPAGSHILLCDAVGIVCARVYCVCAPVCKCVLCEGLFGLARNPLLDGQRKSCWDVLGP